MSKRSVIAYCVLLTTILFVAVFIRVPEVGESQSSYTQNSGDIIDDGFVGQTFVASQNYLSSIGIIIATHSGRDNTYPVIFHLKESVNATSDLRTITVHPKDFGDNQFYDFAFKPITDAKGKTFFVSLTSPESVVGNAIAVDISTKDPYPSGVAYVRGSGRQAIDIAFRTSYKVPFGIHAIRSIKAFLSTPISPLWYWAALPIVGCIIFTWWVLQVAVFKKTWLVLLGLAIVAFVIRFFYARSLPFTFDEGNYLYDAWALLHGHLAGGDGYVKAPLVIAWIALWEAILGHTAMAGRIATIVAGSALVYPIYLLTKTIWNQKAAFVSAALWAVMGSAVVATVYVHTQSVAIFFGVSGLAMLAYGLKEKQRNMRLLIGAGAVIGLAVASRKSMLGLGLTVILLLLTLSPTWKARWKYTQFVGIGFLTVLALFFTFAYSVYGTEGVIEAIGINSALDGVSSIEDSQIEQVRAYSLRGMTPFFRESLPLILLSLLGLGFSLQNIIIMRILTPGVRKMTIIASWLIPLGIFWWAWEFFAEYEGEGFMRFGIPILWPLFGLLLLTSPSLSFVRRGDGKGLPTGQAGMRFARALLGPVWVGSLAFFYMNWIKFHANYISEFIPPLALLGGVGVVYFVQSAKEIRTRFLKIIILITFVCIAGWSAVVSNFITYLYEHTGTFTQTAAGEAAQWANKNIPHTEEIFTGAALIPYLSDHRVSLDIAHPRWYAYEFTRTNPKRLNTFLPPAVDMLNAFRNADWILLESQTGFSFLMEYSEIEKSIETDWQNMKGIENGSNTMTFYKRIK